jgi:hypothetical protein
MLVPTWYSDKKGNVLLNDLKRYVKGAFLVPPQAQVPLVIPAAPSATIPSLSPPIILEGNEDAVSEVYSAVGFHDAGVNATVQERMSLTIQEIANRRVYMNRAIPVNHIFGSRLRPGLLDEPMKLEQQSNLQLQFFNNSILGPTGFRFAMEIGKVQASVLAHPQVTAKIQEMRRRGLFLTPFWLTSNAPISLAAAGAAGDRGTFFFLGTRDIFLYLFSIISSVIVTGGPLLQDNFEFQILDAKTNRPLQNQPVLESCGTGTVQFPYYLPWALYVEPFTQIPVTIRNLNPFPIEVFFTFRGVSDYVSVHNPFYGKPAIPQDSPYSRGAT